MRLLDLLQLNWSCSAALAIGMIESSPALAIGMIEGSHELLAALGMRERSHSPT